MHNVYDVFITSAPMRGLAQATWFLDKQSQTEQWP